MIPSATVAHPPSRYQRLCAIALRAFFLLFFVGCAQEETRFDLSQAVYVGRSSCVECHREEAQRYASSHHDLAMQPANEETVLGDFNDKSIEHHGVVSRMFRDGDRFMVNTEGPTGELQDFEIRYVFGVEPLQQYMVEFPPSAGQPSPPQDAASPRSAHELPRIQVLSVCWDTQARKWFHLSPPDVAEKLAPDDELHWTGIAQRWNTMCADCHSTGFEKRFTLPTHPVHNNHAATQAKATLTSPSSSEVSGQYRSTFSEIDVSCEACHGPGSVHVELANQWFPGWNRQRGFGLADLKGSAENQIQACAPCHSRRSVVHGGFRAGNNYYDYYTNALLVEPVYYADGQVLDEDYVHGSFIQSKMYHKGIRCTDCHDPHTARLKHDGNAVCTSCHQHPAAKYDTVAHHFHPPAEGLSAERDGTQCVNCHMPATTYMQVDSRRDHSLRIPRPDLSVEIGTPNACAGCHLDLSNVSAEKRSGLQRYQDWMLKGREGDVEIQAELERANRWCNEACEKWYGENRRRDEHFGEALAAAQSQAPDAREKLLGLLRKRGAEAPSLARATALQLLLNVDPSAAANAARLAIQDEHPLVRSSAAAALIASNQDPAALALLTTALSDPIRSVRVQAARTLLEIAPQNAQSHLAPELRRVIAELEEGISANRDHGGAHLDLGLLAERRGLHAQAIKHYETAIAVEPRLVGPRANLADLLERSSATDAGSGAVQAEITRLRKEELPLILRNARLLPDSAPLQYRAGLALYLDGQSPEAAEYVVQAAELDTAHVEYAQMAAMLFEELQNRGEAVRWAAEAVERSNHAAESQQLLERIKRMKGSE